MGLFAFSLILIVVGVASIAFPHLIPKKSRLVGLVGIITGIVFLLSSMIVIIDAGEVGAVIIFGKVQGKTLNNGFHLVPPYAEIVKYPVRLQNVSMTGDNAIEIRVNNDLSIRLDATVYYTVSAEQAGNIYKHVAKSVANLESKFLIPIIRSEIRNVGSQFSAEEIYSSKRTNIAYLMGEAIAKNIQPKGVNMDKFLIREVKLPEIVERTIQEKIQADQKSQTMEFKKQQAERQAEIKVIEAKGLAQAQRIINSTLSPYYLQHEAIEAYTKLAGSPNTTFVILPSSPNASGMPLILNGVK